MIFRNIGIRPGSGFFADDVFQRMRSPRPASGAPLFEDGSCRIPFLHAHDETEKMYPACYRHIIDSLLKQGVCFDPPEFIYSRP